MSVLLTDGLLRKTLATVRSLGGRGIPVCVGETTRFNPAAFSKYCGSTWVYPDPREWPDLYLESLLDRIAACRYDVFMPMDDTSLSVAMDHEQQLRPYCHVPLPPRSSFDKAADKGLAAVTAREAGVDAPDTVLPESLDEVQAHADRLGYPLVIKPRRSSGSRGIRIVRKSDELQQHYLEVHARYPNPVLQEYIPTGDRFDVCLLYDHDGTCRASFVQKELRHYPHPIGPSTLQESVWFPELVERSLVVMSRLPWYGVVELEYMVDPRDGLPKLMEINPRFWNSLFLAVHCGMDFPYLLYRLACGEKIEDHFNYRIGARARNLLPGDILHFLTHTGRWSMNPPIWASRDAGGADDILSWNDPMPTLGFVGAGFRHLVHRKLRRDLLRRS